MTQPFRMSEGGLIDRTRPITFRFNGRVRHGYCGDTIASALLANGIHHVARSIKYHRPRGIISAGLEEPSALLTVQDQHGAVPNLKATEIVLRDGMEVRSQNHWPSLNHDLGRLLRIGSRLLSTGFYYKTFMWPQNAWHQHYEKQIRRIAGHGIADVSGDPSLYDQRNLHCDILVIGGGAAGLAATVAAARGGASVALVEQDHRLGGSLLSGNPDAIATAQDAEEEFAALSNVTVLKGTLAFGVYDQGYVLAVQSQTGHPASGIMWKIRTRRIVLASGAIQKPLVFPGNDLPGIMLAGAVRSYINRFAVRPGENAVLAISNPEERAETERCLQRAGIRITGTLGAGETLLKTRGGKRLTGIVKRRADGRREALQCDLLCVSGGWSATAHLFAQSGASLTFDDALGSLVPASDSETIIPVGGARGSFDSQIASEEGHAIAHQIMGELGMHVPMSANLAAPKPALNECFASGRGTAFVDLQNDVTSADITQAVGEGYQNIELVKRYTTLGMGTDQGKTSWTNAIEEVARQTGQRAKEVGHTTFRPAYSPVSIGALVGAGTGRNMVPVRRTPFHASFEAHDCVFQTSGDWLYSRYFPQPGETMQAAITREVLAVRNNVGCVDMSTLGKYEVHGSDAREFLSRVYCNNFAALKPGRLRYGLMLREDGIVFDDGTIACLSENRFLITATTATSISVWRHLKRLSQLEWPDLDVFLTEVTDQWASLAIAGPKSRNVLQSLEPDFDIDKDGFPFASVRSGTFGRDLPARVFSVSFSGELSFEINVPSGFADTLFDRVMSKGGAWGITPYGLETLDVLRIEKGHLSIGTEIDGRRTPADIGLGHMVSDRKAFVGRKLLERPAFQDDNRPQLVGLQPIDGLTPIPPGAHLSRDPSRQRQPVLEGYLTASVFSPTLGHPIALAWLKGGASRHEQTLWAHSPVAGQSVEVKVSAPHFYDPKGTRLHG